MGLLLIFALGPMLACRNLTGDQQLPAGIPDPSTLRTQDGALSLRTGALVAFRNALQSYLLDSGLLTDELGNPTSPAAGTHTAVKDPLDQRVLPNLNSAGVGGRDGALTYNALQYTRASAGQAIAALAAYAPAVSPALRGELYAIQGYAELLLADLFCSGVPLSTLDFNGDFTLREGSTTQEVYTAALAKFDTAIALSGDSARILAFATVGKARTLVEMDSLGKAAQLASTVPDGFTYTFALGWNTGTATAPANALNDIATVSDHEGINGLPYRSSGDPRSVVVVGGTRPLDPTPLFFPTKYGDGLNGTGYAPYPVADWVEARLIQAEAAVRAHDSGWLTILNLLRTDGTVVRTYTRTCQDGVSPCPVGVVDTTWGPGTAIGLIPVAVQADIEPQCADVGGPCSDTTWYKGLRPLTDPGTDSARIAVVMRERAYWLFLTGHRQGDLRRLVRNYRWSQAGVYPTGAYLVGSTGFYGREVTAQIPPNEDANPLFHGCFDREA